MQFTPDEEKMIAFLRRQHTGWPAVRVITLTAALICGFFAMQEYLAAGITAMTALLFAIAAMGMSHTLGSWAGRPEVSLLLKLADAARDTNSK